MLSSYMSFQLGPSRGAWRTPAAKQRKGASDQIAASGASVDFLRWAGSGRQFQVPRQQEAQSLPGSLLPCNGRFSRAPPPPSRLLHPPVAAHLHLSSLSSVAAKARRLQSGPHLPTKQS